MKRSSFRVKLPARKPAKQVEYRPRPRAVAVFEGEARMAVPVPKENPLQHEGYIRLVRSMPCKGCGIAGFTQFCHSDEGKGLGIKSDCRAGWPGCGPRPGINGCHYDVGTSGFLGREGRRKFEREAAAQTRSEIRADGLWPPDLPEWSDDEVTA